VLNCLPPHSGIQKEGNLKKEWEKTWEDTWIHGKAHAQWRSDTQEKKEEDELHR
jgi:hypothetical protein